MADTNLLVLAREYKKLREEVKKVLSMPKGDKGDRGEKGEKGDTGDTGPQGFPGRDGKDGINGYNGSNGRDGVDGKDGKDGLDGIGVANAYIDFDNSLVIVLSDGREINAGYLAQETKDAVIANFKQGAQTLNELLPSQSGNTGKVLKTNGTSAYWADSFTETVFTITDSSSVDINPSNGTIQLWTLGANRTPTATNFASGQSLTLMIADGAAYAVTWTTIGVIWVGGIAPTLPTTGYGVIELWKVNSTIYGAYVGAVA